MNNKGSRGSANNWYAKDARNLEWFKLCDVNDVEDTRLLEQNKKLKNIETINV